MVMIPVFQMGDWRNTYIATKAPIIRLVLLQFSLVTVTPAVIDISAVADSRISRRNFVSRKSAGKNSC